MKAIASVFLLFTVGCTSPMQKELDRLHSGFDYVPDYRQHGVTDYWIASTRGDCEDFALLLQQRLARKGVVSSVATVKADKGYHAVLLAEGRVLDNRSLFPRKWKDTGYELIQALPVDKYRTEVREPDFDWGAY